MRGQNNRLLVLEQSLRRRPSLALSTRVPVRAGIRRNRSRLVRAYADTISYEVPPPVPELKQPTNGCWAASTAILHSWRDQLSRSISDIIADIPGKWSAVLKAQKGLSVSDLKTFFAAAGLIDEPPMNFSAKGWESLLRTYGPIMVTTTNDMRTPSVILHARILIGISGDGTADGTTMTLIDPYYGQKKTESLGSFIAQYEKVIDGRKTLPIQVVHLPADARRIKAAGATVTAQGAILPVAGAVASLVGAGFSVYSGFESAGTGDIHWKLDKMEGAKYPNDERDKYKGESFNAKVVEVGCFSENLASDRIEGRFSISFEYSKHAVGSIVIFNTVANDALGWGLNVNAKIMPKQQPKYTASGEPYAVVEIVFTYHFNRSIGNDAIYIQRVELHGHSGQALVSGRWTQ